MNAIGCQQLTVLVGIMLLNRLARTRGMAFGEVPAAAFAFPAPEDLGRARPETLGRSLQPPKGPRVHLLDDLWLLAIFAISSPPGLPWLVSSSTYSSAPRSSACSVWRRSTSDLLAHRAGAAINPGRKLALMVLHAVGVVVIAVMWHYAGGIHNPAFLLVFAAPVVGAIFLSRWQPYAIALLAILAVAAVALDRVRRSSAGMRADSCRRLRGSLPSWAAWAARPSLSPDSMPLPATSS